MFNIGPLETLVIVLALLGFGLLLRALLRR